VEHGSTQNANVEKQVMGASSWSSNGAHGAYFMVTRSELGVFAFALLVLIVAGFVWAYRRKVGRIIGADPQDVLATVSASLNFLPWMA